MPITPRLGWENKGRHRLGRVQLVEGTSPKGYPPFNYIPNPREFREKRKWGGIRNSPVSTQSQETKTSTQSNYPKHTGLQKGEWGRRGENTSAHWPLANEMATILMMLRGFGGLQDDARLGEAMIG